MEQGVFLLASEYCQEGVAVEGAKEDGQARPLERKSGCQQEEKPEDP